RHGDKEPSRQSIRKALIRQETLNLRPTQGLLGSGAKGSPDSGPRLYAKTSLAGWRGGEQLRGGRAGLFRTLQAAQPLGERPQAGSLLLAPGVAARRFGAAIFPVHRRRAFDLGAG